MTQDTTSEGPRFGTGELAMALVVAALAQALVYPQAAYMLHALVCTAMLLVALVLALMSSRAGIPRGTHAVALGLIALTVGHAWWNGSRGPVPVYGWDVGSHTVQFAIACVSVLWAAGKLSAERASTFPRIMVLVITGLLTMESVWGVYVSIGPEGWPRTYATLAAEYAAELDPNDMIGEGLRHALSEARAAGTLGAPNVFAGFAATGAVLAFGGVLVERGRLRILSFGALVACVTGVWLSGSRGGLFALAFGIVLLALWSGALARVKASLAAVAATLVLMLQPATCPASDAPERSRWLGHTTIVQRLRYWETGMNIWHEAPLFGRGAGAYRVLYSSHRIAGAGETQFAHNWIVQNLSESGVVGLALTGGSFGLLLILGARGALGSAREDARSRATYCAALGAASLTLLTHGLVDYTLETREGMLLLGVLLGAGAGSSSAAVVPLRWPAVLIGVGAVVSTGAMQAAPIRHEIAVENAIAAVASGDASAELKHWLSDAFDAWPNDPRGPASLGRVALRSGDPGAVAHLERAAMLNPWSAAALEELAYARLGFQDRDGALLAITRANELHPLDPTHWLSRAEIEFALNHEDAAREALARAGALARNPQEEKRLRVLQDRIR